MQYIVRMCDGVARNAEVCFKEPLNLSVAVGENVAFVGENGSGKSLLVDTLLGRYPLRSGSVEYGFSVSQSDNVVYKNVQYISFRDIYGSSEADYCYQLRWNVHEQEGIPSVRDVLELSDGGSGIANELLALFGLDSRLDELVVALSSGELRKLQIVKALLHYPRLLVLDNPFIGLDAPSRQLLSDLLKKIVSNGSLQIFLLLPSTKDIPEVVDSIFLVKEMAVGVKMTREEYMGCSAGAAVDENDALQQKVLSLPAVDAYDVADEVLSFNNVTVKYGACTILNNITWRVNSGDVWLLKGANGSGKSTLLSLVCADNLQSYACDITLFGRKRGTGESIWDIKRRIGYVSPEMHRSYLRNIPVKDIVASGLFDTIGLYRRPSEEQVKACSVWMELFGISHIAEKSFLRVSSGEQRLALLARAFVKDPSLLILDEPMHGLDSGRRAMVKGIIEAFSKRKGKTIIFVSHYEEDAPSTVSHRLELVKPIGNM